MKKRNIISAVVLSMILPSFAGCVSSGGTAEALQKETYRFGRCYEVEDGVIMTTEFAGTNGGIRFISDDFKIKSLPKSVKDEGDASKFTVYAGKIYFLVHAPGSEIMPGSIYSCDMNGKKMTEIVNNASSESSCYIKNGYIYYDNTDYDSDGEKGIYRVKIDGKDKKNIVPGMHIEEINDDGLICLEEKNVDGTYEYVHYSCDFDGSNLKECEYESPLYNETGATFRSEGIQYTINGTGEIFIEKEDGSMERVAEFELDRAKYERLSIFYVKPDKVIYGISSFDGENATQTLYRLPK
ncbi:MAG: hypothetical protein J1G06_03995 [Oscillospiraceae bacterium]|nr:hypothetical protein [Oscillospiraceae bacterium]